MAVDDVVLFDRSLGTWARPYRRDHTSATTPLPDSPSSPVMEPYRCFCEGCRFTTVKRS